jgi:hypothetical protein
MGTNALATKERVMPTHFTPTRFTITLVIVVLAGISFKQTLLAQHVGAVTKNAGLDISQLRWNGENCTRAAKDHNTAATSPKAPPAI